VWTRKRTGQYSREIALKKAPKSKSKNNSIWNINIINFKVDIAFDYY